MNFEKIFILNDYYDYYGMLLTERQKEIFKYYYHDDLSYQEIADILGISRAGVYDTLKRTVDLLEETENKLGFVKKYDKLIKDLLALNNDEVNAILEEIDQGGNHE